MPYFVLYSNMCTAGLMYSDIVLCTVDKVQFLVTLHHQGDRWRASIITVLEFQAVKISRKNKSS